VLKVTYQHTVEYSRILRQTKEYIVIHLLTDFLLLFLIPHQNGRYRSFRRWKHWHRRRWWWWWYPASSPQRPHLYRGRASCTFHRWESSAERRTLPICEYGKRTRIGFQVSGWLSASPIRAPGSPCGDSPGSSTGYRPCDHRHDEVLPSALACDYV